MAEQQTPVVVMQAEQKKSKGSTIVTIILIVVLVTFGFYGYSWASSDIGKQKISDFFYTVKTEYNPFYWYGEQLKGARSEFGQIWATESNATAEKVGIQFKAFEAVGSKIVPSGTPLAFRYKFDVGEGVNGIKPKLTCKLTDKSSKYISEEELIESKTFRPENIEIFTENPLSYSNILCQVTTKKRSEDRIITAEGAMSFPFNQRGSLTVYFTKDMVNIGKKFFEAEGIKEKLPILAKYNNEPVELGIGVSDENIQPVIVGENQFPAVGISLKNRWNGRVTKVTEMSLILPKEVTIDKQNSPSSLLCPFGEPISIRDKYVKYQAEKTHLDQLSEFGRGVGETFETAIRFFCWLEVDEGVLEGKPHTKKEYSADVSYEYEFQPRTETITLKGIKEGEPTKEPEEEKEVKYYLCINKDTEKYSCVTTCKEDSIVTIYDNKQACEADLPLYTK